MKDKQKKNKGLIILALLFSIYLIIQFSYSNGYLEYQSYNKMILTKEAMERFENDVNSGKDITINDYIATEEKNYSSKTSRASAKIGKALEKFVTEGLGDTIKLLSKFFS